MATDIRTSELEEPVDVAEVSFFSERQESIAFGRTNDCGSTFSAVFTK